LVVKVPLAYGWFGRKVFSRSDRENANRERRGIFSEYAVLELQHDYAIVSTRISSAPE
jgi:hypothetical protein